MTADRREEASEPEHPVKRKLRDQILPWLESAHLLERQWFYRLHQILGYVTDVTIALGSIGMALPLATLLTQPLDKPSAPNVGALSMLPHGSRWLYYISLLFVVAWVVLRVAFNREDGQKRAVLAKSCRQTMKQAEAKLYQVLVASDPMPELNKLCGESIAPAVDRHVQEGSWPWNGPAPDTDSAVEAKLALLCRKFESRWAPVDPTDIRR